MNTATPRPRGRPRQFDRDDALEKALDTFWARGYSSTSLDDLTGAMGINRPSLYASFGNKHDLFLESIDRYNETVGRAPLDAFLGEPDIRNAVAAFFDITIECASSRTRPNGCLIMNVAVERSVLDSDVRKKLAEAYKEKIKIIADRFSTAREAGQIEADSDPAELAHMIASIMQSLASRARVGASRKELSNLADGFLRVLFPQ